MKTIEERIAHATGATLAVRTERIQSVWSGYGELARYELIGSSLSSVVAKHVEPGPQTGFSHQRKLRSYAVEAAWYQNWNSDLPSGCSTARAHAVETLDDGWLFVLDDLNAAGFTGRHRSLEGDHMQSCLRWLATFHAHHLGRAPDGLWPTGTYWHLETRPDELDAMSNGPLKDAAHIIDQRLSNAQFQTIVHGDAKPANFCFQPSGDAVAAVDFQYVGGGCGMKDVAYLLQGNAEASQHSAYLDIYFQALQRAVPAGVSFDELESEWRNLYPWAVADFQRFLAGWSPSWRSASSHELRLTDAVIQEALST